MEVGRFGPRRFRTVVAVNTWKRLGVKRGEDLVLAEETGKWSHAGQRARSSQKRRGSHRHHSPEPTESSHVNHSPHGVHDGACPEEQERLEESMRHEVEDRGGEAEHGAGAEACKHVAKLADGGIGEHSLEIILHHCNQGRDERRGGPNN